MVASSIVNAARAPEHAASFRALIGRHRRPVVVSFASVAEIRYGAMKAKSADLRILGLERDLARLVVVQPDDRLIRTCAELRARCEELGQPLGQKIHEAERWIASIVTTLDVELVSDDGVIQNVPARVISRAP